MIPFASLCILLILPGGVLETAARDLSALGCTFRLPPRDAAAAQSLRACEFRFRTPQGENRRTLSPSSFTLTEEETTAEYTLYRLETGDKAFRDAALAYMRAVMLLAPPSPGKDGPFPDTLDEEMCALLGGRSAPEEWGAGMALFLDLPSPGAQEAFLALPAEEYFRRLLARRGLSDHPLARMPLSGIRVGNPFCPALRPSEDLLRRLGGKAASEGLALCRVLAPVSERETDAVLRSLEGFSGEVTVNDFGTALLLKDRKKTLGVLLNRRWKDVRLGAAQAALLRQNDACGEGYLRFLRKIGFDRLEWEACGYDIDLPQMKGTLCLPLYQMNTSSRCPLRALKEHGDRGRQDPMGPCSAPCTEDTLLYPRGSGIISRWNTLFGCDSASLADALRLQRAAARGVDRLLIDL